MLYIIIYNLLVGEDIMMRMDWKMANGQILMIKFVSKLIDKLIVFTIKWFMLVNI